MQTNNFKSYLSPLFDGNESMEDAFRKNSECRYASTELALIERIIAGEIGLEKYVNSKNLEMIKKLMK
jgi:hypothetical protein